jgi:hypothetical protein
VKCLDKFHLFSSLSSCKVCIQSARSALTKFVSTQKLRRDSVKLPFARSAKRLLQGVHSRLQEAKPCIRIYCKACTDPKNRLSVEETL